ncbi:hypothetical protein Bca52824_067034 [Brassica carinata]|uniref:Uncharacterized protein n=1 Tax=Brassica carinata TaxID=52824 RepID=A0A8X7QLA7_BRACI|nr:hypothetical protein Bca52824_067034 [Brassica carinata]
MMAATPMEGKWVQLKQEGTGPGARSSHAIALVGNRVYAFGGEFQPRVPVDNHLYVFDLHTLTWSIQEASGDAPPPRVGVAMAAVGPIIYFFGGRDENHQELNELYSFDTSTNQWKLLSSGKPVLKTEATTLLPQILRTCMCLVGAESMDVSRIFGLTTLLIRDGLSSRLLERAVKEEGSRARGGGREDMDKRGETVCEKCVFHCCCWETDRDIWREVDPSDLGHMGAGCFTAEAYGLDTETLEWRKWEDGFGSEEHPGPRGWCAFAAGSRDGKEGLLVYGGNSPSNDRLDDIFFFTPNSTHVVGN